MASWPKNYAYSYGHRDSFGFTWDSTGQLWAAEDGPSCVDEINKIEAGANYGWGPLSAAANGDESKPCKGKMPYNTNKDGVNITLPVWYWPADTKTSQGLRPPAPTGIAACISCGVEEIEGQALMGSFNAANLQLINIANPPSQSTEVVKPRVVHDNKGLPILAVEACPSGTIFFTDATGTIYKVTEPA